MLLYLRRRRGVWRLLLNSSPQLDELSVEPLELEFGPYLRDFFSCLRFFLPLRFDFCFSVSFGFIATGFVPLKSAFMECFCVTFVSFTLFLSGVKFMLTLKLTAFPLASFFSYSSIPISPTSPTSCSSVLLA